MNPAPPPVEFPPALLPFADTIRPYLRPCLRLEPTADTGLPTQSYLGGPIRYWPGDWQHPRDDRNRMLPFLLQLNFGQMPPLPDFPTGGLLQLFMDQPAGGVRGVYTHPVLTDAGALWSQADINAMIQSEFYTKTAAEPLAEIGQPGALGFTPVVAPPDVTDPAYGPAFGHLPGIYAPPFDPVQNTPRYHKQYSQLVAQSPFTHYQRFAGNGLCSTIGGYGRFPQRDDPRQELPAGADWIVLLKLLADDHFGMMWGDCRELHVFIRQADLRQQNFSNLWLYLAV